MNKASDAVTSEKLSGRIWDNRNYWQTNIIPIGSLVKKGKNLRPPKKEKLRHKFQTKPQQEKPKHQQPTKQNNNQANKKKAKPKDIPPKVLKHRGEFLADLKEKQMKVK